MIKTLKMTVTLKDGSSSIRYFSVNTNKIRQMQGIGLSGKNLYDLAKKGSAETVDHTGTTFRLELTDSPTPTASSQEQSSNDQERSSDSQEQAANSQDLTVDANFAYRGP